MESPTDQMRQHVKNIWPVACQAPLSMEFSRIPEWVASPFSIGSSWPRDKNQVSYIEGRFFTAWATGNPPKCSKFHKCHKKEYLYYYYFILKIMFMLPWWLRCKESVCNAGDPDLILGSGRSSGEGNGNPLQYSWLETSMNRGAWRFESIWL